MMSELFFLHSDTAPNVNGNENGGELDVIEMLMKSHPFLQNVQIGPDISIKMKLIPMVAR